MNIDKSWELKKYDDLMAEKISRELGISRITATLLTQRGILSAREAEKFLYGRLVDLSDPYSLSGMAGAVSRIEKALSGGEKIVIYGDYDVDGICSTVLLKECLVLLGGQADYYVPDRFNEGYGINSQALEMLAGQGYKLLISVDCGITSIEETDLANRLGLDIIITDHHTPLARLPAANAIINPKLDNNKANLNLAGVGVVFKLVCALCRGKIPDNQVYTWLDLVALATVADIVPLEYDNRILVKYGLQKLINTSRPGLKALIREVNLEGKALLSWHISFVLAPRLNSAGRLDSARDSIDLLLCNDPERAREMAIMLGNLNNERKTIEEGVFQQALLQVENDINLNEELVLVLSGEGWHQGVIGIVASRLAEKYRRPAILISWEGEVGKGSGRSWGDFNLYQALAGCDQHLIQFGGHRMAAGLNIAKKQLGPFKEAICARAQAQSSTRQSYQLYSIDVEIEPGDINDTLLQELELMQPFGEGNPRPCFVMRSSEVIAPVLVGTNQEHLKFKLKAGYQDAIAFHQSRLAGLPLKECYQDIIFELEENEFRGIKNIQLKVKDMKCNFLPDNNKPGPDRGASFADTLEQAVQELMANRPVLFIYPTYRSMIKHRLVIDNYFLASVVEPLHGKLNTRQRIQVQESLYSGSSRIFLMTGAFYQYYCRHYEFPDNLRYVVAIWPREEDMLQPVNFDGCQVITVPGKGVDLGGRCIKKGWEFNNSNRTVIYTNRPGTIKKLNARLSNTSVEAGVNNLTARKTIRRQFLASHSGVLLADGTCTSGLPEIADIDELVFADAPYGNYEVASVFDEIAASRDFETLILFDQGDLDFNRNYLNRLYPDSDTLEAVWEYFKIERSNSARGNIKELASVISRYLQRKITGSDLLPVLRILVDLNLFQVKKKGSIMEIKLIKTENSMFNASDSPYYLEGAAEKLAFSNWEMEINKYLMW